MIDLSSHLPILVIITPLLAAFTVPVVGLWNKKYCYFILLGAFLLQSAFALRILKIVIENGSIHYYIGGWIPPWGIEYAVDLLNAYVLSIVTVISLIIAIYAKKSVEKEISKGIVHFYALLLLLVTGLSGIVVTGDIFNLYVFLEISSLAAYALIAVGRGREALMASFNYVIMGTISACFILLGIGNLYMVTGSLNMIDLAALLPSIYSSKVVLTACAFFCVGFSIKIALFPLHIWLPNAYTYAPSAVSSIIAATMSKVGVYAFIRIMYTVFSSDFIINYLPVTAILGWVAALAIIVGSIMALAQYDLKRMLAYSSISQIGYVVLGIALANPLGMAGGLLHILNHALMKGCLFLVAGAIIYATGFRNIHDFRGLGKKMPLTMAAFIVAALSMIGVPPTVGFLSKWYLALGAIDAGNWIFLGVILLSSLLNLAYFWRVIDIIYFSKPKTNIDIVKVPISMNIPILILAFGCVFFGVFGYIPMSIITPMITALR